MDCSIAVNLSLDSSEISMVFVSIFCSSGLMFCSASSVLFSDARISMIACALSCALTAVAFEVSEAGTTSCRRIRPLMLSTAPRTRLHLASSSGVSSFEHANARSPSNLFETKVRHVSLSF